MQCAGAVSGIPGGTWLGTAGAARSIPLSVRVLNNYLTLLQYTYTAILLCYYTKMLLTKNTIPLSVRVRAKSEAEMMITSSHAPERIISSVKEERALSMSPSPACVCEHGSVSVPALQCRLRRWPVV